MMMESGTHDYMAAQVAAERRDNIPTLSEVKAITPMVELPGGGIAPAKLPDFGWAADVDGDRDSAQAAELARLVRDMDDMADELLTGRAAYSAQQFAEQWRTIRKITKSNQPKGEQS